jgi:hypothetical protein
MNEVVDFEVGLEQRLALLGGEELGDLSRVLLDQLASVRQGDATIFGRRFGPRAEGLLSRFDRLIDIPGVPEWDTVHALTRSRIADFVRPARYRADAFATYQHRT